MPESVIAARAGLVWGEYVIDIEFVKPVLGGVPGDPKIVEGWLRTKAGITDEAELRRLILETLAERGVNPEALTDDDVVGAVDAVALTKVNGFKRDEQGIYIEDRQVKSMIKECVNILYAGDKWGKTRKGPRSFTAERVFVSPQRLHFNKMEPDGVITTPLHKMTARGPISALERNEYADAGTTARFVVKSLKDEISEQQWFEILELAEQIGLGAGRSQSYGQFVVTGFAHSTGSSRPGVEEAN